MLNLSSSTSTRWLDLVQNNLEELLIDHAHCEKKAAGVAMNLLFGYVEKEQVCRAMSEIVREELEHFQMVLDLLKERDIRFRKLPPSSYGNRLHQHIDKQEPRRAVDRFLVAGLIEARSCERFAILRDHLNDAQLASFFGDLFESEARHHSTYVQLAKLFANEEVVTNRLQELSQIESSIIDEGEDLARVHS